MHREEEKYTLHVLIPSRVYRDSSIAPWLTVKTMHFCVAFTFQTQKAFPAHLWMIIRRMR